MRYVCILVLSVLAGCSRSNNVFLGRVEAQVGSHTVIVTDCYRIHPPQPQKDPTEWHYTPCRDADVIIRADELIVNGTSYGRIKATDTILVDHGVVSTGPHPDGNLAKR